MQVYSNHLKTCRSDGSWVITVFFHDTESRWSDLLLLLWCQSKKWEQMIRLACFSILMFIQNERKIEIQVNNTSNRCQSFKGQKKKKPDKKSSMISRDLTSHLANYSRETEHQQRCLLFKSHIQITWKHAPAWLIFPWNVCEALGISTLARVNETYFYFLWKENIYRKHVSLCSLFLLLKMQINIENISGKCFIGKKSSLPEFKQATNTQK